MSVLRFFKAINYEGGEVTRNTGITQAEIRQSQIGGGKKRTNEKS